MKRVICFGEALIDFLNTGQQPEGELLLNSFTQFPGGAPANAAVAVAKLGGNAVFAGQVGDDQFGHFLIDALVRYGVDTSCTAISPHAPTALAFVFLDSDGERSFSFRRDRTADIVITREQVSADWFRGGPIVHFCSNTLTDEHIADVTSHVVEQARQHGAVLSFDVNLRHNLWPAGAADVETVNRFVHRANIVKFSAEEFEYLCGDDQGAYLERCFATGVQAALITDGPRDLEVRTPGGVTRITPPAVTAVDTTGGGDAFVGAVLYGLSLQENVNSFLAHHDQLRRLASSAAHCGAIAVTRKGAFPSFPTAADVADAWDLKQ